MYSYYLLDVGWELWWGCGECGNSGWKGCSFMRHWFWDEDEMLISLRLGIKESDWREKVSYTCWTTSKSKNTIFQLVGPICPYIEKRDFWPCRYRYWCLGRVWIIVDSWSEVENMYKKQEDHCCKAKQRCWNRGIGHGYRGCGGETRIGGRNKSARL